MNFEKLANDVAVRVMEKIALNAMSKNMINGNVSQEGHNKLMAAGVHPEIRKEKYVNTPNLFSSGTTAPKYTSPTTAEGLNNSMRASKVPAPANLGDFFNGKHDQAVQNFRLQ